MTPHFVHLHLHSEYSLVDGIVRINPLIERAASMGMAALALTDECNLFALVKFYRAARSAGIKPVIGADLKLKNEANVRRPFRLTLLCQNQAGYRNLTQLISRAYVEGQTLGVPMIQKAWLNGSTEGLIALSGIEGDLGAALTREREVNELLTGWLGLFSNRFYLEISRVGRPNEALHISKVAAFALEAGIPLVATNEVRFLRPEDFEAHEARVSIQEGTLLNDEKRPRRFTEAQYFRTEEEMLELFSDLPSALANTVEIAKRCNVEIDLNQTYLPDFPIPAGKNIGDYLVELAEKGLSERQLNSRKNTQEQYVDRLHQELTVIINMGFSGYFLIVADFIQWAKSQGIPVGPGRGSGAGSLVAYAISITDIDPMEFDLLFERFLNPERVSMPDFDIDFCMIGRDRVIQYVEEKYGRENVAQIITYGHMAAKAVIRDVGRVLGHPYGFVDQIAKLIPFELGMTLDKALKENELFKARYEKEEEVKSLVDLARKLEGIARNAGKHAGGVVIAPKKLTNFTPLYCEEGGKNLISQFDKDDIESIGLVKFDFLGLKTLTIIDWAAKAVGQHRGESFNLNQIPRNDTATFDLIRAGKTTAVFQLESRGMKDLIIRLKPDCFEDIIALVALFRPGPLQSGMVDDFINRKHGLKRVFYPHPALEPILKPTYGVILYQEQVMQIAQVLAGYTLGAADLLRRAMGKKKAKEMAKQREIFLAGAIKNGVSQEVATHIFDLMEKFVGYGFNKSHSAAYAMLAYQTAWLKTHYLAPFMAAVLSADMDNTDKVVMMLTECRTLGISVLPPNIQESDFYFKAVNGRTINYGLGAIKGVGGAALEGALHSREQVGPFSSLLDFVMRTDLSKANKRVLGALIKSGALDPFGVSRSRLMGSLPRAVATAEQVHLAQGVPQSDLFALEVNKGSFDYLKAEPWTEAVRLKGEKDTLGHYVTGHPLQSHREELQKWGVRPILGLQPSVGLLRVGGMVAATRIMRTKRGDKMAFMTLDDGTARLDVTVFSDLFSKQGGLIEKEKLLVVEGEISTDDFTGGHKMLARNLWSLVQMRNRHVKQLSIKMDPAGMNPQLFTQLEALLAPFKGGSCPVAIQYRHHKADVVLGTEWRIHPEDSLLLALQGVLGQNKVEYTYETS